MPEDKLTIYHNPNCSKSRETLNILQQRGKSPEIVKYLDNPPDRQELKRIIELLGIAPRDLLRTNEPAYQSARLEGDSVTDEEIVAALYEFPSLLQRPIVVLGNRAIIGRPPNKVLELFG